MKKSLFITFFHCFVCILNSGLGTWSLAPVARSSRAFCHIDFLSHLWWEILGTWMRNWATSCLGWVTSTTNKWNNCNKSCRSSQQTCLYDSLRSVPAFSLVLPQIHGHLCREGFDSCGSHVATLQHCTNWYHDQLPPVCSEWYGGVFNLFFNLLQVVFFRHVNATLMGNWRAVGSHIAERSAWEPLHMSTGGAVGGWKQMIADAWDVWKSILPAIIWNPSFATSTLQICNDLIKHD